MPAHHELKQTAIRRIMEEGRTDQFHALIAHLKSKGVAPQVVTSLAIHLLPPESGSAPELPLNSTMASLVEAHRGILDNLPALPPPSQERRRREPKDKKKQPGALDRAWRRLREKIEPERSAGNILDKVWWLYENYGSLPNDVDPDKVPSRGALEHLKFLNDSPVNYSKFLDTWAKLIPDRKQLEQTTKMTDDNREIFEIFDDFDRLLEVDAA
jgi:hypothetical protein